MTIYWDPIDDDTNPDSINVWHVADDGTQTDIGPADVSDVPGMPDKLGGIAPDAVREVAAEYMFDQATPGNSPSINTPAAEVLRDGMKFDYIKGTPP